MKKATLLLAFVSLVGIPLAGCGTIRGGHTVVKYDKEATALIMTKASSSGTYALYSTTDWHPKGKFSLKEGDPLGFKGGETGKIIAVAGQEEIPLSTNSTYYWKKAD